MSVTIRLIISYMITFAVYNIGGFESTDILMGALFVGVYMLLGLFPDGRKGPTEILQDSLYSQIRRDSGADDDDRKRLTGATRTVTVIWTLLYVIYMGDRIGRDLHNPLFRAVYIVLTVCGLYMALYYVIRPILMRIMLTAQPGKVASNTAVTGEDSVKGISKGAAKSAAIMSTGFLWKRWLSYLVIFFGCMLPLFLLNFPGTMTVDSFEQLSQARGLMAYSDHHPWVHTMIIKALYSVGYGISGSVYGGIATYTLFQMLIVAMSAAYAIVSVTGRAVPVSDAVSDERTAKEEKRYKTIRILMLLGFILYPYNLAYSITMWKDVIFAASVLVLTVTIYRIYVAGAERLSVRDTVLFVIGSIGMCLLRHNGLYAYIITMAVILIYDAVTARKAKKASSEINRVAVVLGLTILTLLVSGVVRGPVQRANNVEAGDFAHNIPIPMQQIARVVYDGCELTPEETEALEKINTIEYFKTEYTPGGADPTMQWVVFGDSEYLESHKGEYIALWLKLGIKHPGEYFKAYIDQTKGYYSTMAPEQTEYYGILPNNDELEPKPVLGATVRIKINEICEKLHTMFPVYGILYSMGACFMLLILGTAILVVKDDRVRLLTYLPVVTLTLTLLIATPLCADLRYSYPLMLCMPVLGVITLRGDK